jgi:CRP-like cAMP-binding protein
MAKRKYIETPELLWDYFLQYKKLVKNNPILVKDWVGKDADQVYKEKEKPLTMEGFENYLADEEIISDLSHYLCNLDNRYSEYVAICSRIKRNVRQDQIEGGMVGIYNPSITQRINNLKESTDITSGGDKIQTGLQKIEVEITRPNEDKSNTSI